MKVGHNQEMRYTDVSLPVAVAFDMPRSIDVDVLVVPAFEGEIPSPDGGFDAPAAARIAAAMSAGEFSGKPYAIFMTPATDGDWRAGRVMLVGAGKRSTYTTEHARRVASAGALAARERKLARVAVLLTGAAAPGAEAQAMAEGLSLATYYTGVYKSDPDAKPLPLELRVVASDRLAPAERRDVERGVNRGYVLGLCSNLARGLANEPANSITPASFAEIASRIAVEAGLHVDVLDEDALASLGMNMLLGVARGSMERPRLVVLRYEPVSPASQAVLGLVGKGVTFDAGGISLKPSDGMHRMKTDMTGGASVVAAMKAIAALKPDVRVLGIVPLVENMPSGTALRPGDVLTSAEGKTVEVLDTDAEGRLVLGDALWYARHLGATHLVDVATLTGAIGIALGRTPTGLFGTPEWWATLVQRTAASAGDRTWVMPLFEDYKDLLKSDIADLANIGGRPAGAITAAIFLKEFTGGLPWVHLDIAWTAWADEAEPYQPKGPTGVAVRTLAELAFTAGEWPAGAA